MSALPQPDFLNIDSHEELQAPQKKLRRKTAKLSRKKQSSASLQLLIILQRGTFGFATIMMLGSIAVYLSTVRIPQLWSQEYENLEALQRQERDLVAVDEALKYEIARQAEQAELAMSAISSENTVFLTPNSVEPQIAKSDKEQNENLQLNRLGY